MTQVLFVRDILPCPVPSEGATGVEDRSYGYEKASTSLLSLSGTRAGHQFEEWYHGICPASYIRFLLLLKLSLLFIN
jgi:hypothetical protein